MRTFRDLKVWEKSHLLTLEIYTATAEFPRDALHGLTSQMRRSCASIPTSIAEGSGRRGNVELARFLRTSLGSASEIAYCLCSHTISGCWTTQSTNALPGR